MNNKNESRNIIGYMELGDGETKAISTLNNDFLTYTFEQEAYWGTLRDLTNIFYNAYIDHYQHTNISPIEGKVIVKTEYSNYKDFESTVPQRQDIRIESQHDTRVDYIEFQASRRSKPPVEVRSVEYFSYSLTRGRNQRAIHMWLLAEAISELLHENTFSNYILMDEANHHPHPNATNILYVDLEQLSQTNSPAGELAGVLLGKVKTPKDPQVKLIFENLLSSFDIFKDDKEAHYMMTRGEQREAIGEAKAEAKAEAEKIENAQKMIEDNLPIEMIKRYTGLSSEKIRQLQLRPDFF